MPSVGPPACHRLDRSVPHQSSGAVWLDMVRPFGRYGGDRAGCAPFAPVRLVTTRARRVRCRTSLFPAERWDGSRSQVSRLHRQARAAGTDQAGVGRLEAVDPPADRALEVDVLVVGAAEGEVG